MNNLDREDRSMMLQGAVYLTLAAAVIACEITPNKQSLSKVPATPTPTAEPTYGPEFMPTQTPTPTLEPIAYATQITPRRELIPTATPGIPPTPEIRVFSTRIPTQTPIDQTFLDILERNLNNLVGR